MAQKPQLKKKITGPETILPNLCFTLTFHMYFLFSLLKAGPPIALSHGAWSAH